jgi:hypothetical protein
MEIHKTIRQHQVWRAFPKYTKPAYLFDPSSIGKTPPRYELAKLVSKHLKLHVPLPYAFNIYSSVQLIESVKDIPININTKFASFHIANMYCNVPTKELGSITKFIGWQQGTDDKLTEDLTSISRTVMKQNYF